MDIVIRTLEKNDYNSIYYLIHDELGYENLDMLDTCKRIDLIRDSRDYQTFVAVQGDKVIGFIGLCKGISFESSGVHMRIIAFAVNKEFQNKGIGSQLLDKVERYAMEGKVNTIGLSSGLHREKAHSFYEHRGYLKKGYSFKKSLSF